MSMYDTQNVKEQVEKVSSTDKYIKENEWYVTASKLKYFLSFWWEAYDLKFNQKIKLDEDDEDEKDPERVTTWNAFDDLKSYWQEAFFEKYYIDEWLTVDKMIAIIWKSNIVWKPKKDELLEMLYWNKIRLTKWQWKMILWMYRETLRQPIIDSSWEYLHQQEIIIEYMWIPLRMKLDRLSLEKQLIRDWKTVWRFDRFEYDIETTFDYVLSMAFYFIWVKVKYWVSCDVILDALWKTKPYPYIWYKLNKENLLDAVEMKIKPGLIALKECMDTWVWKSVYPINYETENRYGQIISYKKWEPIARTKLMDCEYYHLLEWSIAKEFVQPIF